jgi:hypothetical protein
MRMEKMTVKNIIIRKYEETLKMESSLVELLEKSDNPNNLEKIESLNNAINKILTDIDILAYEGNIGENELDEIFSKVY